MNNSQCRRSDELISAAMHVRAVAKSALKVGPSQRKQTCVVIAGMHRSGTSAVTRVANLLGAELPKKLIPPTTDNVRGFWEPGEAVRIHNQLLQALGTSSSDPLPLPAGWQDSIFAQRARLELAEMIESEFADCKLFVIKDPRISRLLPLWLQLLDDIDIDPLIVIPFRNPLEVAASLRKRDRMSLATSLLLYVHSYLTTEQASRGRPRCFLGYDELLEDWQRLERKLRAILGERLPPASFEQADTIEQFLTADLRHHRHDREDLAQLVGVSSIVIDIFDLMSHAANGGDAPTLWRSFDELHNHADSATMLYREIVLGERQRAEDAIHSFEHSMSWRITAPLRWIRSTLSV